MASTAVPRSTTVSPSPRPRSFRPLFGWAWVGLLPFLLFVTAFMLFPAVRIVAGAFTDVNGQPTLANLADLNQPVVRQSLQSSLSASAITALMGGTIGFLVAWAITLGNLPQWIRNGLLGFCGVASNFAGVPLVFAFFAAFGRLGIVTTFLNGLGIKLYTELGFRIDTFFGLCLVYTYFQIPLMILIMVPALEGLRKEWREAAENLGASRAQYWAFVAFPILTPAILGTLALLFANAFGTHATAVALIGGGAGQNMIMTIMVANQFSGDALSNPTIGFTLSFAMVVVVAITILFYSYFRRLSEQWLSR